MHLRWPAYPAYKPSGLPWLGDIPVHWEVASLRRKLQDRNDGIKIGPFGSQLKLEIMQLSGYKVYGQENVISRDFAIGDKYISDDKFRELASCAVQPGDLVISMMGTTGRCQVVPHGIEPGIINSHLIRVRVKNDELLPEYASLLIDKSDYVRAQLDSTSKGAIMQGLNSSIIKQLVIVVPPLPEQRIIAAFLDRETAHLDALIARKERLIELLGEKRAALISQAVTRGLDPSVPVKDSGVPWLGQIPAHWEVKRIRAIAESLQTGPFGSQLHSHEYVPGGIPVVNPAHMKDGRIVPDWDCAVDDATWQRLSHHELREGDIVFARRGEMGRCALVTSTEASWLCGTGSLRMRPNRDVVDSHYLNRVLSTKGVGDWLLLESVGTTMDNLNTKILANVPVPAPPLSEQRAIAAHLDRETAKLDALIAKVRVGIEKLREYRAALIAAAVTGKIDVRTSLPA